MSMTPPVEAPAPPRKRGNPLPVILVVLIGTGLLCVILIAVFAAILFPVIAGARRAARRTDAMIRIRSLARATRMYASDNDDRLPIATAWMDGVAKYDPSNRDFYSPGLERRNPLDPPGYGIAFMRSLSANKLASIESPAQRVMIFDSKLMGRNATSGLETVPKPPRFGNADTGGNVIGFVDGHARLVTATDEVNLK